MGAVFFDLDGTLLDTVPDIRASLNATLAEFGYPGISYEETCAFVGNGAKKLVVRALKGDAENVEEVYARFRERYGGSRNVETRVYDGIKELLARLKARGVKLAVVTNKPQNATERVIEKFFPDTFDFVGGDDGSIPCKPDPSLARYAALTMRVAPRDCVFVGDGETDVLTAKNAGMREIAVLWGYRTREQLASAGATAFASSCSELEKMLKNLS